MKKAIGFMLALCVGHLSAAELEPILSLKGLFKQVPERLGLLSPEERRLRSEFDRIEGGIHSNSSGMTLVTSDKEVEGFGCASLCSSLSSIRMYQDRGGISWNMDAGNQFRIAPKAEFIRYEYNRDAVSARGQKLDDYGLGLGLDSTFKLSDHYSWYASAGALQLTDSNGYEGLLGFARQKNNAKLFVEARWTDMQSNSNQQLMPEFNDSLVRIGISRRFSGF